MVSSINTLINETVTTHRETDTIYNIWINTDMIEMEDEETMFYQVSLKVTCASITTYY